MTIGTKTLLFGAHQFLLHPLFVAAAWWKLYGPPLDPRLWFAFFLHDVGYLGKPNLDGPEGETHPELGARIMKSLFGEKWGDLCLYHSRSIARKNGRESSLLSHADKLATSLMPRWLYLLQVKTTGEFREYLEHFRQSLELKGKYVTALNLQEDKNPPNGITYGSIDHWYWAMTKKYTQNWVEQKRSGLAQELEMFRLQANDL